jgi:hypothetical protein
MSRETNWEIEPNSINILLFIFIRILQFVIKIPNLNWTRSSKKNYSPAFLWYDMDRIENDASNNSSFPREVVRWVVT